jgi:hypothetical protein
MSTSILEEQVTSIFRIEVEANMKQAISKAGFLLGALFIP